MRSKKKEAQVLTVLRGYFEDLPLHELTTSSRSFPITARADLQTALEALLGPAYQVHRLLGVHQQWAPRTTTFAHLIVDDDHAAAIGPLQYEEVDLGETRSARCLRFGLWLCEHEKQRFAVFLSPAERYGETSGMHLEIAIAPGESGSGLVDQFLRELEEQIFRAGTYRGKVISLEGESNYRGQSSGIKVHKLRSVSRQEVILPEKTLALLERNLVRFVEQRQKLHKLGLPTKKGLLFYGPPGTGKTHTIHYLSGTLAGHTTLLITAAQVGLLGEYMQLARFLQPAIVVIEDVDLIARNRRNMNSPCEESLLNHLLNDMDGLREDAEILFILTTNRPEELEPALASRPGRIDQAIEFPLPDDAGRRQLIRLYARGLTMKDDLVDALVRKTENGSAALIKELMRRSAQFAFEHGREDQIDLVDAEAAMEEMLFAGGTLNAKLLGVRVEQRP